jgi:predicted O-methyltransferase YrrM
MKNTFHLKQKDYVLIAVIITVIITTIVLRYIYNLDFNNEALYILITILSIAFLVIRRSNNVENRNAHIEIKSELNAIKSESSNSIKELIELINSKYNNIISKEDSITKAILKNHDTLANTLEATINIQEEIKQNLTSINSNKNKLETIEQLLVTSFSEMAKIDNIQFIINQIETVNTTNITNLNLIKELNNKNIALIQEAKKVGESQHLALSERISELYSESALLIENKYTDISSKVETLLEGELLTNSIEKVNEEIVASEARNKNKLEDALRLLAELNRLQIEQSQNLSNKIKEISEENKSSFVLETNIQKDIQNIEEKLWSQISELNLKIGSESKNIQNELTLALLNNLTQHLKNIEEEIHKSQANTIESIGIKISGTDAKIESYNQELNSGLEKIKTHFSDLNSLFIQDFNSQIEAVIKSIINSNESILTNNKQLENKLLDFLGTKLIESLGNTASDINNNSETLYNSIIKEIQERKIDITSVVNTLQKTNIGKFDSINESISKIGIMTEDFINNKVDMFISNNINLIKEQLENISKQTHSFIQNEVSTIIKSENDVSVNKITSSNTQLSNNSTNKLINNNKKEIHDLYNQIDALLSINSFIQLRHPLPIMRGWPASPDFILRLINVIFETKPKTILDVGSGVTSLIAGYCIEKIGSGKVVSLDHDEKYYNITKSNIEKHGLEKVIELNFAPLREYDINNKKWLWYDNEFTKIYNNFDLIIVDGPPGSIQKLSRYPVLHIMQKNMAKDVTIILDDGKRPEEKEIVEKWITDNKGFKSIFFNEDEKGTFVISNSI